MKKWLEGKKTYFCAGILFIVGGLRAIGIEIPDEVFALLGAAGFASMKAGIERKK